MKTFVLTLCLIFIVLAQMPGSKVGGFKPIEQSQLSQMQNEGILKTAIAKARAEYIKERNDNLGEVVKVSEQIVSGVNYRIVFNSGSGPIQVTVYCQAWTETYEVTEIKSLVEEN